MGIEGKNLGNRYEILVKIGSGGMATVYKAKDNILKRFVAIKILRDEFITDEEFIKKFEQEAQSAARLTHPNIVSIYDVGVEGNLNYIVMELIKGKTLKEIILEEKRPLPWKWSVNIASQIASALDVAHRNNIIHRDIKPHNIIITEDGIAKVTDFGIAKAVSNSTITAFGKTMGSVHYFSPEHARGGMTNEKSDIYSLGVVLYEMVTGKLPFDSDTPVSVALKHMQEDPIEPRKLNPKVPKSVNDIIMKALQKDPNKRYQTAEDLHDDLLLAIKEPNGDFVEQVEYDPTAKTQIIDRKKINKMANKQTNEIEEDDDDDDEYDDDEYEEQTFFQKNKVAIITGTTILVAILVFFIAKSAMKKPEEIVQVAVPDLIGKTVETARRETEGLNLKFAIEKEEYSATVEKDHIISQDPTHLLNTALNKVDEGTEIKVVVSKGPEQTKMPYVVGLTKEEAVKLIEEAKLKAEFVEETSRTVAQGTVISQDVPQNKELNVDDTVKIVVSSGTDIIKVTMISVVGQSQEEATKNLEAMNLKVTTSTSTDDSKENGVVLKQSVVAGNEVEEGTTITLTINKVDTLKTIPVYINVYGITGGATTSTNTTNTNSSNSTNTTTTTTPVNPTATVTIKNGTDVLWSTSNASLNDKSLKAEISGRGQQTNLKLEIKENSNGKEYVRTFSVNFNTETEKTLN